MSESKGTKVRIGRVVVLSVVVLTLTWLTLSMSISISVSLMSEKARSRSIPKHEIITVRTQNEALKALTSIRVFHEQLYTASQKFFSRFRKSPENSIRLWRRWEERWLEDFEEFGRHYTFSSKSAAPQVYDETLLKAFAEVGALHRSLSDHFEALYNLELREKSELDNIYTIYRQDITRIPEK